MIKELYSYYFLIAIGCVILTFLYWDKNNSKRKGRKDDTPLPFQPYFKLWLFGFGFILLGIVSLIVKLMI